MAMPRKPDPTKHCPTCGERMSRKRINGRLEDRAAFLRRVYCDRTCMALGYVKDVPSHKDAYHWRARRMRSDSCEFCGATENLHAHHVDGRRENNSPENIQTLCGSCHSTHHHRARRAGLTVAGRMD
jgi:hypothetical protein